jgi:hypothetical protein
MTLLIPPFPAVLYIPRSKYLTQDVLNIYLCIYFPAVQLSRLSVPQTTQLLLSLRTGLRVRDKVSQPSKSTDKIMILYILNIPDSDSYRYCGL